MSVQLFLVAEGKKNSYPKYGVSNNQIYLLEDEPVKTYFKNPTIVSPIFSLEPTGYANVPNIKNVKRIGFFIVQNPFPTFAHILSRVSEKQNIWFSLGLANLVVFDEDGITLEKVTEVIKCHGIAIASEIWYLENNTVINYQSNFNEKSNEDFEFKISEKVPGYVKFTVTEYYISLKKILNASKKFTPQYYDSYKDIFKRSSYLVNNIFYLFGDNAFSPTEDVIQILNQSSNSLDNIINDRYYRIVQLTSALSYVYSQTFCGSFPLFDHIGIVRRHSLLGLGCAVNALYELVSQLEEVFVESPIENLLDGFYQTHFVPLSYSHFEPRNHSNHEWSKDSIKNTEIVNNSPSKYYTSEKDYFNRFAFFSGRLGFREYDFSATAAIEVLIASTSLQWNVINYTHEIIHNHVRVILNNILNIEDFNSEYEVEDAYLSFIKSSVNNLITKLRDGYSDVSYKEYFLHKILLYCIYSQYFGSLSKDWNESKYKDAESKEHLKKIDFLVPNTKSLIEEIKKSYRDISEIFVHIIDLKYIYKNQLEIFIVNLWSSWATVPVVTSNLRHYILRSLLVIATSIDGHTSFRFSESIRIFKGFLEKIVILNAKPKIFNVITGLIKDKKELDHFKMRFSNCLSIADLANNFLHGYMDSYIKKGDSLANNSGKRYYDINRGTFTKSQIESKLAFIFDQLIQSIDLLNTDSEINEEHQSAWLLLALSSNNKKL